MKVGRFFRQPVLPGGGQSTFPTLAAAPRAEPHGTPDKRMQFHRAVHEIACRIFGTVLGPEANEAHRNHFHFDLAERKLTNFCE